jgi:hypothetical protein
MPGKKNDDEEINGKANRSHERETNQRTLSTMMNTNWRHEARKLSVLWGRCVALRKGGINPHIRQVEAKQIAYDERIVEADRQNRH